MAVRATHAALRGYSPEAFPHHRRPRLRLLPAARCPLPAIHCPLPHPPPHCASLAMAENTPEPVAQPVAPIPRTTRPMSEALLNEKARSHPPSSPNLQADKSAQWDRCLSSMLIRSGLGVSFGIVFSVLLFKRRAWPAWVGLGFGAGRAWEECDSVRSTVLPTCPPLTCCSRSSEPPPPQRTVCASSGLRRTTLSGMEEEHFCCTLGPDHRPIRLSESHHCTCGTQNLIALQFALYTRHHLHPFSGIASRPLPAPILSHYRLSAPPSHCLFVVLAHPLLVTRMRRKIIANHLTNLHPRVARCWDG